MDAGSVRIERLTARQGSAACRAALELVFGGLSEPVRDRLVDDVLAAAVGEPAALGELWRAVRTADGATVGACWAQLKPKNFTVVWPPQWTLPHGADDGDPLVDAAMQGLAARGINTAQSLVADQTCPEARALQSRGFRVLADLLYMAAGVDRSLALPPTEPPLPEFVPVDASYPGLVTLVDATYRDTLDCPALDGLRPTADVVDEYRTIGAGGDALWRLVRRAGRDVGCLLLADHPQHEQLELVYMGLVPEARGRGWGIPTVVEALRLAQELGRARVVLAVDAANWPAVAMYERAGFVTFDRRTALLFSADHGAAHS